MGVAVGAGTTSESMLIDPPPECVMTIKCVPIGSKLSGCHSLIWVWFCAWLIAGPPKPSIVTVIDPRLGPA